MSAMPDPAGDPAETDRYLAAVKRLVLERLAPYDVGVTLFGSRARGTADPGSDVDIALELREPVPPLLIPDLREALEESTIPYRVDLVELGKTDDRLREIVRREGLTWRR